MVLDTPGYHAHVRCIHHHDNSISAQHLLHPICHLVRDALLHLQPEESRQRVTHQLERLSDGCPLEALAHAVVGPFRVSGV